jgi:hypothetical protein
VNPAFQQTQPRAKPRSILKLSGDDGEDGLEKGSVGTEQADGEFETTVHSAVMANSGGATGQDEHPGHKSVSFEDDATA